MDNGMINKNNPSIEPESGAVSPEVSFHTPPNPVNFSEQTPEQSEQNSLTPEQNMDNTPDTPAAPLPPMPDGSTLGGSPETAMPNGTIEEQNPEIAVDGEKLEKGWAIKTEKVITQTQQDPYEEEKAVNALKADYMAKRFNRHLGDRNK